ncbi:DUF3021 domain-containing protein [Metabacillus sp. 84]|uniref:DUF3021 domain-containing protein n=1 Tax=unclassified Metabacillus TaxID=2675274 RepID=UPI003CEB0F27
MMIQIVKRSLTGLGFSSLFTFAALSVFMGMDVSITVTGLWKHMLGSMVVGIYFGVSSLIFEFEKWSLLKQMVIHFTLSVAAYFTVAVFSGWFPLTWFGAVIAFVSFVIVYFIIWFSIYSYMKKMESSLNSSLRK